MGRDKSIKYPPALKRIASVQMRGRADVGYKGEG